MFSFTNNWQIDILLFLVFAIIYFQFYKLSIRHAKNDGAAVVLLQFTTALISAIFIPFFEFILSKNIVTYIILLCVCVLYSIYDRLQGTARKNLEVSTYSIINQLNSVFMVIFGFIFFKEEFFISKLIGTVLIILGNICVLYNGKKIKLNKYIWLAMIASTIFAISYSMDIFISKQFNLPFYITLTTLIPGLFLITGLRIKIKDVIAESKIGNYINYLITGLAWFLSCFFSLKAFQHGEITKIAPIQSLTVILNVIVAYFLFKEKNNLLKKVIASILVCLGMSFIFIAK